MNFIINTASTEEKELLYSSLKENDVELGCFGHLRGDFDTGNMFYTTWWEHCEDLKTQEFKDELDFVVNQLRTNGSLLKNLDSMATYCLKHTEARLITSDNAEIYGFKIETDKYSYYIRCTPLPGEYHFYIYCYLKEQLARFLQKTIR